MKIRIATFNSENLFARYRFREGLQSLANDGFTINDLAFKIYNEDSKKLTARAIKEVDADIICLQEVENLPVLDRFKSYYLADKEYAHRIVIDGRDPRFIDVGFLSKLPIKRIKTYRHLRNDANTKFIFSRDCLEVDFDVNGTDLTLYANHFKSMIGGRAETKLRREEQTKAVAKIIDDRWAQSNYGGYFAVLGDFNDYEEGESGIDALLKHPELKNPTESLSDEDNWTHFWNTGGEYRQLDYILLSKNLNDKLQGKPVVMRKGLPYRATKFTGDRFPGVGFDEPKASDHAPLYIEVNI